MIPFRVPVGDNENGTRKTGTRAISQSQGGSHMKSALSVILGVAAVAFVAAPLTVYAGGTISGKVTYAGKSENKEFLFSKFPNPKFCPQIPDKSKVDGDKRFLKQIEVSKDGGLKGAVVAVVD